MWTTDDEPADLSRHTLRRREMLVVLGGLGVGAAWRLSGGPLLAAAAAPSAAAAGSCVLTPEVTEGPYYIANHLTRRNITDGQAGLPLVLHITMRHATSCTPIAGADVELW